MKKTCIKCHVEKSLDGFYANKNSKDGKLNTCKSCRDAQTLAWRKRHPSRVCKINRSCVRRYDLKNKYGLTVEEHSEMKQIRNNCCDICGQPEKRKDKSLAVDHCHETGKIRGMLCGACNTGIGNLQDDPVLLMKAAEYVLKHRGSN